jgi:hypothetical protein
MKTIHGLMGASKGIRLANWTKSRATTRVFHSLVVLSLAVPSVLVPFPVRRLESSPSGQVVGDRIADLPASLVAAADPVEVARLAFRRPAPRVGDRPGGLGLPPSPEKDSKMPYPLEDLGSTAREVQSVPPNEPFAILESHAEHAHQWI